MTPEECRDWHGRELTRVDSLARDAAERATEVTAVSADRLADISRTLGRVETHVRLQWWMLGVILVVLGTGVGALLSGRAVVTLTAQAEGPTAAQSYLWATR